MSLDIDHLKQWIGRTEHGSDEASPVPVAAFSATLNSDRTLAAPGDALPPLWHWLYFLPMSRQADLGPDGHPRRGGFLPPVTLPRRMWAGSRLRFDSALRVGERIERVSRIAAIDHKRGATGDLIFLRVAHEISNAAGLAIAEEQDIVYRDMPDPKAPSPPPKAAPRDNAWEETVHPDETLLFRYSALTFNSHRIHYDRTYATDVEGYPGLVVQGPFIAMLLLDLLRRMQPGASVQTFSFRAIRPLFDVADFSLCGRPAADGRSVELWTRDSDGWTTVEARATLA